MKEFVRIEDMNTSDGYLKNIDDPIVKVVEALTEELNKMGVANIITLLAYNEDKKWVYSRSAGTISMKCTMLFEFIKILYEHADSGEKFTIIKNIFILLQKIRGI